MGKDNTLLYVIGGAAAIYFLTRSKGAQAADGGGLLPDINIGFPEIQFPEIKMPDIKMPDIEVNFPSFSELFGRGGGDSEKLTSEGNTSAVIGDESAAVSEWNFEDIRNKAGTIAGVGTGLVTAVGTSKIVPIATRGILATAINIAPKFAAKGVVKLGLRAIPVIGWGYAAADVGATIYELISGKSILGNWLGSGEMIREIF